MLKTKLEDCEPDDGQTYFRSSTPFGDKEIPILQNEFTGRHHK